MCVHVCVGTCMCTYMYVICSVCSVHTGVCITRTCEWCVHVCAQTYVFIVLVIYVYMWVCICTYMYVKVGRHLKLLYSYHVGLGIKSGCQGCCQVSHR